MSVDAVASIDQARRGLHDGAADVIVTGVPVDDTQWAALLDELRAAQPRLRVVELVDDDDAFAFSVPDADGRHASAAMRWRAPSSAPFRRSSTPPGRNEPRASAGDAAEGLLDRRAEPVRQREERGGGQERASQAHRQGGQPVVAAA